MPGSIEDNRRSQLKGDQAAATFCLQNLAKKAEDRSHDPRSVAIHAAVRIRDGMLCVGHRLLAKRARGVDDNV
jgi:hypothetical protein